MLFGPNHLENQKGVYDWGNKSKAYFLILRKSNRGWILMQMAGTGRKITIWFTKRVLAMRYLTFLN